MNEAHLRNCAALKGGPTVQRNGCRGAAGGRPRDESRKGPGRADHRLLPRQGPRLTAVEIDERLASALAERMSGSNVEGVHGDGTRLPFDAAQFSAATLFTMLHHVPSAELQDKLLAEVRRVVRPGGLVVGTDGMATPARRELHEGDDYLPITGRPGRPAHAAGSPTRSCRCTRPPVPGRRTQLTSAWLTGPA